MLKKMTSMARTVDEIKDAASPSLNNTPKYSYGLTLCLDQESLDKLDLDHDDVEVGDMLHLFAMAEVTSVSKHDSGGGEQCRVELQLTHIGLQDEDSEYEGE